MKKISRLIEGIFDALVEGGEIQTEGLKAVKKIIKGCQVDLFTDDGIIEILDPEGKQILYTLKLTDAQKLKEL